MLAITSGIMNLTYLKLRDAFTNESTAITRLMMFGRCSVSVAECVYWMIVVRCVDGGGGGGDSMRMKGSGIPASDWSD